MLENFLITEYWGNTGRQYLTALIIFVAALIVLKIFKTIIVARLEALAKKTKNDYDDAAIEIISGVKPPFYLLLSLFVAFLYVDTSPLVDQIIRALFLVIVAYEIIKAIQEVIEFGAKKAMMKNGKTEDEVDLSTIKTMSVFMKIVLWSIGLILILGNLGVDVSSLIAGLGIGGIAVALAIQNILGDIFASFSIIIDKPFQVGDFIIIGSDMGNVEKIGIKSTRIRTLQGEELVISNKELTSARIQNFKKMEKRRVAFELGVVYETSEEKMRKIPEIVKKVIDDVENADFDRCHFKYFGEYNLNFETVYYVNSADYAEYMDINQEVNLNILEAFNKAKIEFAYPTNVQFEKKFS